MKRRAAADGRQLVILTGLSGSGKSTVLKTFEDLGYYCVDNLPVDLIPAFSELHVYGNSEIERAALLVDAREGEQLKRLPAIYKQLRREVPATLVFIEATDEALLRRFSETRRPHPLGHTGRCAKGSARARADGADPQARGRGDRHHEVQRSRIAAVHRPPLREPHEAALDDFAGQLRVSLRRADRRRPGVRRALFAQSAFHSAAAQIFGAEVRKVARYIRSFPQTGEFLRRIESLLTYLIPHYIREGKSYLTIAFGCTGGRHRSVMMAEAMAQRCRGHGYAVKVVHRDLEKWAP